MVNVSGMFKLAGMSGHQCLPERPCVLYAGSVLKEWHSKLLPRQHQPWSDCPATWHCMHYRHVANCSIISILQMSHVTQRHGIHLLSAAVSHQRSAQGLIQGPGIEARSMMWVYNTSPEKTNSCNLLLGTLAQSCMWIFAWFDIAPLSFLSPVTAISQTVKHWLWAEHSISDSWATNPVLQTMCAMQWLTFVSTNVV